MRALPVLVLCALSTVAYAQAQPKWTGYKRVPAVGRVSATPATSLSSNIIYLHRCPAGGCLIHAGAVDDSRTDTSSIADPGDHTLAGFAQTAAVWQTMVQCVRDTYAPFDVQITEVDPGNVPHFEEIIGGKPSELLVGFNNAGGIAPFDCGEVPNGISFTFDVYGSDALALCWTVAQETAHTFGLEHEYLQKDPMTYAQGDLPKRFQWVDAPCGTNSPGACQCPRSNQNSYKTLYTLFGVGAPTPPMLEIRSPTDGKKVTPNFDVRVDAIDDAAIDHVELWVDGAMAAMSATAPFTITAPALELGPHALELRAIDVTAMPVSQTINVTQGPACVDAAGCSGTDVCVSGSCLPGPSEPGGLGDTCQANTECISMVCAAGSEPPMHCVNACTPGAPSACPDDFECIAAGSSNVCWPGGGCCSVGGDPRGSVVLAAAALGLVLRRRRRR